MNHITKYVFSRYFFTRRFNTYTSRKRRRILKNNERIAHAAKEPSDPTPQDIQDQGFTRPSVLILLPFRSWALRWVEALTKFTPKPDFQLENYSRFLSEYGLPPDATDKLETAPPGTYPPDHIEMFRGNVDDSFRLGIKFTRKSVKFFADFYQCDIIIASPLGLRMSIDKEKYGIIFFFKKNLFEVTLTICRGLGMPISFLQ